MFLSHSLIALLVLSTCGPSFSYRFMTPKTYRRKVHPQGLESRAGDQILSRQEDLSLTSAKERQTEENSPPVNSTLINVSSHPSNLAPNHSVALMAQVAVGDNGSDPLNVTKSGPAVLVVLRANSSNTTGVEELRSNGTTLQTTKSSNAGGVQQTVNGTAVAAATKSSTGVTLAGSNGTDVTFLTKSSNATRHAANSTALTSLSSVVKLVTSFFGAETRQVADFLDMFLTWWGPGQRVMSILQILFFNIYIISFYYLLEVLLRGTINVINMLRSPLLIYKQVEKVTEVAPVPMPSLPPPNKDYGYTGGFKTPSGEKVEYMPYQAADFHEPPPVEGMKPGKDNTAESAGGKAPMSPSHGAAKPAGGEASPPPSSKVPVSDASQTAVMPTGGGRQVEPPMHFGGSGCSYCSYPGEVGPLQAGRRH